MMRLHGRLPDIDIMPELDVQAEENEMDPPGQTTTDRQQEGKWNDLELNFPFDRAGGPGGTVMLAGVAQ